MMFDSHADGVDQDCDHNASAEILALHDAPEFPPHIIPHVFTMSKARPLSFALPIGAVLLVALLLAGLFNCIFLIFLSVHRVSHSPRPLFQSTYGAVLRVLRDSQTDGVGQWLRAVVLLALVGTVGCWTDTETVKET